MLPDLRIKENKTSSELQRFTINFDNQEKEIERANLALEEVNVRIEQIKNDISREEFLFDNAKQNLERVKEETSNLLKQQGLNL